jgi:hypothetical protein
LGLAYGDESGFHGRAYDLTGTSAGRYTVRALRDRAGLLQQLAGSHQLTMQLVRYGKYRLDDVDALTVAHLATPKQTLGPSAINVPESAPQRVVGHPSRVDEPVRARRWAEYLLRETRQMLLTAAVAAAAPDHPDVRLAEGGVDLMDMRPPIGDRPEVDEDADWQVRDQQRAAVVAWDRRNAVATLLEQLAAGEPAEAYRAGPLYADAAADQLRAWLAATHWKSVLRDRRIVTRGTRLDDIGRDSWRLHEPDDSEDAARLEVQVGVTGIVRLRDADGGAWLTYDGARRRYATDVPVPGATEEWVSPPSDQAAATRARQRRAESRRRAEERHELEALLDELDPPAPPPDGVVSVVDLAAALTTPGDGARADQGP